MNDEFRLNLAHCSKIRRVSDIQADCGRDFFSLWKTVVESEITDLSSRLENNTSEHCVARVYL